MTINNQKYQVILKESVREVALTQPRMARFMQAQGIAARLYVEDLQGRYFVVNKYQSGNLGQVTPA